MKTHHNVKRIRCSEELHRRGRLDRPDGQIMTVGLIDRPWPTIRIDSDVHGKMVALIDACPIEVGWLSPCVRVGETFNITDVFVPEQVCTMASTTITKDGEASLLSHLIANGKVDVINNLHCWGHSHVDMPVFASLVDEKQTQDFIAKRDKYFVRVIANKTGDLFCSVYYLDSGFVVHHPRLDIAAPATEKWRQWAVNQVDQQVSRQVLSFDHEIAGELIGDIGHDMADLWLTSGYIDLGLARLLREGSQTPIRRQNEGDE